MSDDTPVPVVETRCMYEIIEDELSAVANSTIVDVRSLPDDQASFARNFTKPQAYVCYNSSEFSPRETLQVVVQQEKMFFDIMFRFKDRRGTSGLLSAVTAVRRKVIGYQVAGYDKVTLVKQGYVDSAANDWNYVMTVTLTGHVHEEEDEETVMGVFGSYVKSENNEITFSNDNPNEEEIP